MEPLVSTLRAGIFLHVLQGLYWNTKKHVKENLPSKTLARKMFYSMPASPVAH